MPGASHVYLAHIGVNTIIENVKNGITTYIYRDNGFAYRAIPHLDKDKHILWWLNQLPEPHKSQAIENRIKSPSQPDGFVYTYADSLRRAIDRAFRWAATPQGGDYWLDLYRNL